jgi:hypothetical protein
VLNAGPVLYHFGLELSMPGYRLLNKLAKGKVYAGLVRNHNDIRVCFAEKKGFN